MTIDPVTVSSKGVQETVRLLRDAHDRECVLLWLGRRESGLQRVCEIYKPIQRSSSDYFEIPRNGMAELMGRLRQQGLYVISQVHTHPEEAFHSSADDRWAIVRHAGALSLVLPWFASTATLQNFEDITAVYQLSASNRWTRVERHTIRDALKIEP
jgi:proteasome lid subunit RPN8/RPN11